MRIFFFSVLTLLAFQVSALPTPVCQTPTCISAAQSMRQMMNTSVDPCDNFYDFACGQFLTGTPIPEDQTMFLPSVMDITNKVNLELLEMIKEPFASSDLRPFRLAKNYFADCMDHEKRQALGGSPLVALIERMGGWPILKGRTEGETYQNWSDVSASFAAAGVKADHLVGIRIVEDMRNPANRTIYLTPPGFTDSFQHHLLFDDDPVSVHIRGIAQKLHAVDENQVLADMRELKYFFLELSEIKGPVEEFLPLKMYNPIKLVDMQQKYPYVNWVNYINSILPHNARVDSTEKVVIIWPDYLENLKTLLENTSRRTIVNYMVWEVIEDAVTLLDEPFGALTESLNQEVLGISKPAPAWESCLETTKESFPTILDAMYIRRHHNPQSRDAINELLSEVRRQMSANLHSNVKWMDDVTKQRAQRKIDAMHQIIGYPDELMDDAKVEELYEPVDIDGLGFFEATYKMKNLTAMWSLEKLRRPTDLKLDWPILALSTAVNAFFDPMKNIMVIPAATMQGHLFGVDRPNYLNYASIGTIIGHEINHGFDMDGRLFDERGNLTDWWEPETETLFTERATCLESQYTKFNDPDTELDANAALTKSEDISDNGGVHLLYKTYKQWVAEHEPEPRLPGLAYTAEQLYWIYYGQTWCGKMRQGYAKIAQQMDPHSPYRFRVLGPLSNSESFANDFNCPVGSNMNPATKCVLW